MDDEDGPQGNTVTKRGRPRRQTARWRQPLSQWLAAAFFLMQTAAELALHTASLLLTSLIVVLRAMTWRGQRETLGR